MELSGGTGYRSLAPAPVPVRGDMPPGAHVVQFYADDAFLIGEVGRYIGAALGAGDVGIVAATREHQRALAAHLAERGLDLARAIDQGRYLALDAAELLAQFAPGGCLDAAAFADFMGGVIARATVTLTGERRRVVIFGELVAVLCQQGRADTAILLEQTWNDLGRRHTFSLFCAYPLGVFGRETDGEAFGHICATHTEVIPAEGYAALPGEDDRLRAIAALQQKATALAAEVAARERAQRELAAQNRELAAAVAARDEFLSIAAHELKTPITSLRAYAQLLLRSARRGQEIAPERLEAALGTIERQTDKLQRLMARLLDTTTIEAGELRIEPVSTDLAALVRAVIAQYQDNTKRRFALDSPATLVIPVDPFRFEQVITNLLDNALKFSPDDSAVTMTLGRGDDGGIRFTVTDRGVGIPPEQREAVFDRFNQAHDAGHLSGLGLGLYIARETVALHGGAIWIETPDHPGTRVVVTLPAQHDIPATDPAA